MSSIITHFLLAHKIKELSDSHKILFVDPEKLYYYSITEQYNDGFFARYNLDLNGDKNPESWMTIEDKYFVNKDEAIKWCADHWNSIEELL